jgi:hypothetical protein
MTEPIGESELDHLRERIDSSRGDPGRADNDREIHLVTFFVVVLVVEVSDLLLGTRLRFTDTLTSSASTVANALDQAGNVLFAVFGVLAVLTLVAARRSTPRFAMPVMIGYLSVATLNVIADVATLVGTAHLEQATQLALLWDVGLVYAPTTLVFSLWYQLADAYLPGGAIDFPRMAPIPTTRRGGSTTCSCRSTRTPRSAPPPKACAPGPPRRS